jgi:hypothetical protein
MYEIEFAIDGAEHLLNKITVSAEDDETALFIAGMHFSDEDYNPERTKVLSIERVS